MSNSGFTENGPLTCDVADILQNDERFEMTIYFFGILVIKSFFFRIL